MISLWKHAKISLLFQLVMSVLSLLYALTWILSFQVILAAKNEIVNKVGKDMKQGFPWVLAAQYLMAGVGSVIGVLSAALASISMREIQNVEPRNQNYVSVSVASSLRRKSSSNSAAAFELRKHSFRDNNTTTTE